MDDVLFRCRAAGTTKEGSRVRISLNWGLARRDNLLLTESALVFGNWRVPYTEIEDAVLVRLGAIWWRLIICTRGVDYQFILRPPSLWAWWPTVDEFWHGPLPFALREVHGRLEPRSVALGFGPLAVLALMMIVLSIWLT